MKWEAAIITLLVILIVATLLWQAGVRLPLPVPVGIDRVW